MKKVTLMLAVVLLSGCLNGCTQLTVTDKVAIAEAAADANELEARAQVADCNDPNNCEWMRLAVAECAESLRLVDQIANGGGK